MAVKLNVHANVTGQGQLTKLNAGLKSLGTQALIAKGKLASLEARAASSRATMAGLGTALKIGVVAGFAAAGFAAASFVKSTFRAGNIMESAQIQFKAFFGSAAKGAQAFKILNQYASTVPFSIDQIIQGSTALAAISDGPEDLGKQLKIVGNLAAAANLSFADAALQYQKVASAGIAAADLLRDKGVKALLGFTEGVRYTAEESIAIFEKNYSKDGRFSKVADELAGTLKGSASMVQDFYFQLNAAAAKPLFEGLTKQINKLVGDFKKNDAQLKALGVRVGELLAQGFQKLGNGIKFVIDNFDKIAKAVKAFMVIKIVGFLAGIVAQFILLTIRIRAASSAMVVLNIAMRANILGLIVTGIQLAVIAWIAFEDKIKAIGTYIVDKFSPVLKKLKNTMSEFSDGADETNLDVFDKDVKKIDELREKLKETAEEWEKAANAKEAYAQISLSEYPKRDKSKDEIEGPDLDGTMRAEELARENAKNKELEKNQIDTLSNAHVKAWEERLYQIKEYREQLSSIGIDSQGIATTIGDTWVNGIRAGNSLLQITKDSFKNILATIAETMLRKSIEYGVELLFQALLGKKVDKEKEITREKQKQLMYATLTAAVGGGGGSFMGFAKGGVVPGGAPYTDRVPAMLTPGEVVIPRNKVGSQSGNTNITNINISGNVDQRSIDQIKGVISSASAEVGGANKAYTKNTQGVRGRNI